MRRILSLVVLGCALTAQSKRTTKIVKEMYQVTSPNGKYSIVFQNPLAHDSLWTKLVVRERSGEEVVAEDFAIEEPGTAAAPIENERLRWSPDGCYLVVVVSSGITAKGEPRQQTYRFLNMEEAAWETFKSGRGTYASTNNFVGWKAGAPHTILIISGKGKSEANPER